VTRWLGGGVAGALQSALLDVRAARIGLAKGHLGGACALWASASKWYGFARGVSCMTDQRHRASVERVCRLLVRLEVDIAAAFRVRSGARVRP
jgi:hypothetical protein